MWSPSVLSYEEKRRRERKKERRKEGKKDKRRERGWDRMKRVTFLGGVSSSGFVFVFVFVQECLRWETLDGGV